LVEVRDVALEQFAREGISADRVRFLGYGTLRYENQEHGVEVLLPEGEIDAAAVEEIAADFHRSYEREYTYRLDAPVEFVGELLEPGMSFDGPAIVESRSSTVVVHPGNELTVDDYGNMIISITLVGDGGGGR